MDKEIRIALAGNPNSGKTTLFNALTGTQQYVGNWPGVTVEKKEGKVRGQKNVGVTDLPGIYSLSPYTLEEVVARNYLIDEHPDVILNIVDATNLERNLYLTTQLAELGIPMVVALNMMDIVRKNGDKINSKELARALGCTVVEISALKNTGIDEAVSACVKAAGGKMTPQHSFSGPVDHAIAHIEEAALDQIPEEEKRWYAVKLFERDEKVLEKLALPESVRSHIEQDIRAAEKELDDDAESIITNERYVYIAGLMKGCCQKKNKTRMTTSDKIDRIVTNRWLALPIFGVVMFLVYWIAMGPFGSFLTDWTNDTLGAEWLVEGSRSLLEGWGVADWLVGLISDGIINGVGAVLGFVPQMLVLFLMLCILEDCGYMARIAFIMDRIFRRFGLSGKSFIPMLVGTGCSVPGVMASRTIENGDPAPFVMELPAYHVPSVKNVLRGTWERGWSFIKRAGTVILLSSVIIWFLSSFGTVNGKFGMVDNLSEDEQLWTEEYQQKVADGRGITYSEDEALNEVTPMDDSILADIGSTVDFIFEPLGFGRWKTTVATVTGLVAKEEVVSTFGVLYGKDTDSDDWDDEGSIIWANVKEDFNNMSGGHGKLAAFAFMIFNLLCAPCFAAMGAIKREMNNGKWTAFAIAYMCLFAYAIALITYQIGLLFVGGTQVIGLIAAFALLACIVYMLFRPYKESNKLTVR